MLGWSSGRVLQCEVISFGSTNLPTCVTLQGLVDNHCFSLSFLAGKGGDSVCSSSFFVPAPQLAQCTTRHLEVTYLPISICDTDVTFTRDRHELDKATSDTRMGVPPEVPICLGCDHICFDWCILVKQSH